ncbi:transcription factor [Ganoderma sinense ZZ0214-1]|uniref:Transcription factor n=1 Tax=Ganoderma sinense ZZ0214-1 TaxID=1077348 RepID=A0A2G8S429_9APHY|nr:transcription factor [Ganoderma sinense ZZ0214-1]
MALPLAIPDSPAAGNSPSSTETSNGPHTPVEPDNSVQTLALPPPVDGAAPAPSTSSTSTAQPKRKPSRRANTAERRATHNAVERARRETLNGRFLDLAALLPNLSQIRRPSKSSIVNSSIAHIHASRRHRLLAARELRLLKLESDALRRELNEWRDRSGLPRVDEPVRGEAFQMILSGEVEVLSAGPIEEEGADGDYGDNDYGDDDYAGPIQGGMHHDDSMDDIRAPLAQHLPLSKASEVNPFAHGASQHAGLQLQTILPRPAHGPHTPMIVQSPTQLSFENPTRAAMYDSHPHAANQMHPQFSGQYMQHMNGHVQAVSDEKAAWSAAQMFGAQVSGGPALFTSSASSHATANGSSMSAPTSQQQAYLINLQRQQLLQQQHHQRMTDDASPPSGPISVRRERSGSINSNGSGYGSPASNPGSYEMPSVMNAAAVPRRMAGPGGASWDDGMNMGISGMGMGMMKSGAISVGGGGNGHGYASMML